MKSGDVGALFARLGVKLDDASINSATAELNRSFGGMSAAMKRSTRDGAESLRLIGEGLGIHVSRPLSRVIAQIPGLGTALASLGGATVGAAGLFAIGSLLVDKVVPAAEKLAQRFGWIGESAEAAGKRVLAQNEEVIKSLEHESEMQDKYNRLVLDLNGASFGEAHLKVLQAETQELQKQIAAQLIQEDLASEKQVWWQKILNSAIAMSEAQHGNSTGAAAAPAFKGDEDAAKALDDAMQPLIKRFAELQDEITGTRWQVFHDNAEAAKKDLQTVTAELLKVGTSFREQLRFPLPSGDTALQTFGFGQMLEKLGQPKAPVYGGTADAMELWKVQNDQNEALKKQGEILTSIETPQEKYNAQIAILKTLLAGSQGVKISMEQYTLAVQHAQDEMEKAQKAADRLSMGFRAVLDQMKMASEPKQFEQMFGSTAIEGFENNTVRMLTEGRAQWRKYFEDLTAMALKFMLNKELTSLFTGASKFLTGNGGQASAAATQLSAGTIMQTAATMQMSAAQLMASSGGGGGSGWLPIPSIAGMMASGGDITPGSDYIVGENGPEVRHFGSGGSIVPMSNKGADIHYNIDARGADAGVEDRVMRAIRFSHDHAVQQAVVEVHDMARRSVSR